MTTTVAGFDELTELGASILRAHAVPAADAELVARSLVTADAWGHPSHGMLRLGWYVARLMSGAMKPVTELRTEVDAGGIAVIDGGDGVGQIVADRSCAEAVARAYRFGIGAVAVRNSNHFGTAAFWSRRMADAGMVGILVTNGSPAMAPWGGREKTVGTNPWSIAVPSRHGVVVLDIANTGVARGKIYAALQKGEPIPEGWAIGRDGAPTTDAQTAIDGILAPVGGHKGYGIAFMMDVLAGVLTGSGFGTDVTGPYVPDRRSRCGHLAIAIDIEAVIGRDGFESRLGELVARTKAVDLAPGIDEVFVPGEIENRALERALETGIMLPPKTFDELKTLANEAGVAFTLGSAA